MSNCGYLINASAPAAAGVEFDRFRAQPDHVFGVVAESANRLLLPWLLCFRETDLRPVGGEWGQLQLPCTSVRQAAANLEASLPILEAIAGSEIARPYWKLACTMLRRLPLPYVALEAREVFQLGADPLPAVATRFAYALAGDASAIPHLKALTEWDDAAVPYPIDVLYSMPGGQRDAQRTWNATVLDGGFQPKFQYVSWTKGPQGVDPEPPPEAPMTAFGDLYGVPRLLKAWIKQVAPTSPGAEFGIWPGQPEALRLDVYAGNPQDAARLQDDAGLRQRLDEFARKHLEPWCQRHGFAWSGVRVSVPKWARG